MSIRARAIRGKYDSHVHKSEMTKDNTSKCLCAVDQVIGLYALWSCFGLP